MSESESEDEILDRIETALRRIAGYARPPAETHAPAEGGVDRAALVEALDKIIMKLRGGLQDPHAPEPME